MSSSSIRVPFVRRPAAIEPQQKLIWAMFPATQATAMPVNVFSDVVSSSQSVLFLSRPSQGDAVWTKEERDINLAALLRLHRIEKKHNEAARNSVSTQDQAVKAEASAVSMVVAPATDPQPEDKTEAEQVHAEKLPIVIQKKPRAKRARSTKQKESTKKAKKAKTSSRSRSSKSSHKAKGSSKPDSVPATARKKRGRPAAKTATMSQTKTKSRRRYTRTAKAATAELDDSDVDSEAVSHPVSEPQVGNGMSDHEPAEYAESDVDDSGKSESGSDVDQSAITTFDEPAATAPQCHTAAASASQRLPDDHHRSDWNVILRARDWPLSVKLQTGNPSAPGYVRNCCFIRGRGPGTDHFCIG